MGTRHLIAVQLDGEYKIAQYGQWDGYPGGQGKDVLEFLSEMDRTVFERKLRAARFMTDEERESFNRLSDPDWATKYPHLSCDAGAGILGMVQNAENGMLLCNCIEFAGDSLFCEWAYVIDLDANTLEVFKGFNESPLGTEERFADAPVNKDRDTQYYPVRLAATYSLDDLPTVEDLIADVDPPDDDD